MTATETEGGELISLVYTGTAAASSRQAALTHLFARAHTLNGASEVTGMLRDSFADLDDSSERSTTLRALAELTLWFRVRSARI